MFAINLEITKPLESYIHYTTGEEKKGTDDPGYINNPGWIK